MVDWVVIATIGGLSSMLAARTWWQRRQQRETASATGLAAAPDLTHVSTALQRTALWTLSDGGFEQRVVSSLVERGGTSSHGVYRDAAGHAGELLVTAFDLETLRERRGEWAWLPVEPPFRIGPVVSVVVCEIDRQFPHVLLKRVGRGDDLEDDDHIERAASLTKLARDGLGIARAYAAELPPPLAPEPLELALPEGWRAYGKESARLAQLLGAGLGATLERAGRRDLVVELIDTIVVVYPAARDVVGADAFADLTSTALAIVDGVLAAAPRVSPRGLETQRVASPLQSGDGPEPD